jgi:PAS domain S-box-containing protein
MEYVHPDDRRNVQDVVSQALRDRRAFSNEYRLRRSDGVYRWMFDVASPRLNGDGSSAGFIGSAIDVTDQKAAQQALGSTVQRSRVMFSRFRTNCTHRDWTIWGSRLQF